MILLTNKNLLAAVEWFEKHKKPDFKSALQTRIAKIMHGCSYN